LPFDKTYAVSLNTARNLHRKFKFDCNPANNMTQAQTMPLQEKPVPSESAPLEKTMQAMVVSKYGSPEVLQLRELDKPQPAANEILVKVRAASVTAADGMMRKGTPFYGRLFIGLMKPKHPIAGTGFAGVVEAVGADVKSYQAGDRAFGESILGAGTNAEFVCVPEDGVLAHLPEAMGYEEAAGVCDGALTSLNFLKEVITIQPGQSVLIIGASGSLGTAAVQLAKHFGAEVTGVCSGANVALVKSLGADQVVDYTQEDFTGNGQTYEIIYDTLGKNSFSRCKGSLKKHGAYISPVLGMPLLFQMLCTSKFGSKKAKFSATGLKPVAELRVLLNELVELIEAGKLNSVIDRRYRLEELTEAHRYVEGGHKKGNVVITFD
jgi:NADPH:quinone reductase-like Zn-dependent oxidoreductase